MNLEQEWKKTNSLNILFNNKMKIKLSFIINSFKS